MRISDWSSDVCSSDLISGNIRRANGSRPSNQDESPLIQAGESLAGNESIEACSTLSGSVSASKIALAHWATSLIHSSGEMSWAAFVPALPKRSSTTCRSEEHTSELQSLKRISLAVLC